MKELLRLGLIASRNTLLSMNLLKLPLLLHPRRLIHLVQTELFTFKTLSGKRGLPQKNIEEVLALGKNVQEIKVCLPNKWFVADCSYAKDLMVLCLLCRVFNPDSIFEIGTLDGFTTYHFALNTPEEARIYTLDLLKMDADKSALPLTWMDKKHIDSYRSTERYLFQGTPEERKISCLFGDSHTFDFSSYHDKIDLFFIDGAHSYEYVRSDSLNALACVRKGGILVWHDYGRSGLNGVSKFLHQLAAGHAIFSIPGSSIAFMVKD